MQIKEIIVSYGKKRTKDYQSESHHTGMTLLPSRDDLEERTIEEWFYYYDNKLRKVVNEMFRTEKKIEKTPFPKKEVQTIAYENDTIVEEEIIEEVEIRDPSGIIYGSAKNETEKALLIVDAKGGKEAWIPKKCIKSGDAKSTKFVIQDWFVDKVSWGGA